MEKECKRCKQIKPLIEYFKSATSRDGKASNCKACNVQLKREWVKKNPEKYKAQLERRKTNPWYKNKANMAVKINKQREGRRDLSDAYIIQLITSKGTSGENLNPKNISKELIDAYKVLVQLKRALNLTAELKINNS